jgi:hypothetical protein
MMKHVLLSLLVLAGAATIASAQSKSAAPTHYDPAVEASYEGVVTGVISVTGPDGSVGVHLNVKTPTGATLRVALGPALFIGMNNFSFFADDAIQLRGAYVKHGGDVALWAREVSKEGKTLALRGPDGAPRWPLATAEDPDGCGVSHDPVR